MDAKEWPTWQLWLGLGSVLAVFGGVQLLVATPDVDPAYHLRSIAKFIVGSLVIVYSLWLRRSDSCH